MDDMKVLTESAKVCGLPALVLHRRKTQNMQKPDLAAKSGRERRTSWINPTDDNAQTHRRHDTWTGPASMG